MPKHFTPQVDTSNKGGVSSLYSGHAITFGVCCEGADGTVIYIEHSDPRVSVKQMLEARGLDFDSAIIEPKRR